MVRLVQEFPVEQIRARLMEILELAKRLDKLYIPTRYPNGLPDLTPAEVYTAEEARSAIDSAKRVAPCELTLARLRSAGWSGGLRSDALHHVAISTVQPRPSG